MGVAPEADEMNCHGDYHQIDIHIAIDYFLMWFHTLRIQAPPDRVGLSFKSHP